MAKETLYPQRQRCKKCSKGFPEQGAIHGLYCTYRCAGMAEPFKNPKDAPRWCITEKDGKPQWKKRLRHEGEMPRALRDDPSANSYWCQHCGFLHIGHSRVDLKVETTRIVGDIEAIADVLVKARDARGWTRKEAAERAKIRPIRLKELEEAAGEPSWDALFAVSKVYGIRWAAVFR